MNSNQQEFKVVLLAHQFLLFLVPHGLNLTQQLRLPFIHRFPQFLTGGMNLLLNLLDMDVHLSNRLVNSGDGLDKGPIMALHLLKANYYFGAGKRNKLEKQTLFTKVEMVSSNPWEMLMRRSTSCPLWDSMAHWGQTAVWSVLQ